MDDPYGLNPPSSTANYFQELNDIDVSGHVEQKGKFSYLSWPFAIAELKKRYPRASWEVVRFEGLPYLKTDMGYFVEVSVTVEGVSHSQIHPVLGVNNKPLEAPNPFEINTSIQRALVKAIALHGLGLYIYAGEDLPESEKAKITPPGRVDSKMLRDAAKQLRECLEVSDENGIAEITSELDGPEKAALWSYFNPQERASIKAIMDGNKAL